MRDATLIQTRLTELQKKAEVITQQKRSEDTYQAGHLIDYVSTSATTGWATSVLSLFRQAFGEQSIHTENFQVSFRNFDGYLSSFDVLYAIFLAAKEDFEGGYIFSLRGLVKAEVLSDALEQAEELLRSSYKDPACVLVGVSLEVAVKHLVSSEGIPLGKLDSMNVALAKAGVYNVQKQKQITAWADLRNKSAHGDWTAYTDADVRDMLSGVQRFIADHL